MRPRRPRLGQGNVPDRLPPKRHKKPRTLLRVRGFFVEVRGFFLGKRGEHGRQDAACGTPGAFRRDAAAGATCSEHRPGATCPERRAGAGAPFSERRKAVVAGTLRNHALQLLSRDDLGAADRRYGRLQRHAGLNALDGVERLLDMRPAVVAHHPFDL